MNLTDTRIALRTAELNEGAHAINGLTVTTKIVRKARARPYAVYTVNGRRVSRLDLVYEALKAADK